MLRLLSNRRLYSEIVQDSSIALHSIDRFSSTTFIAPKHEGTAKEREHPYLRPFVYRRFWLDGKESPKPILGISREKQLKLLLAVLGPDEPVCCL